MQGLFLSHYLMTNWINSRIGFNPKIRGATNAMLAKT